MSLTVLLIAFAISLAFVLVSIIKFKMHPFLALIIACLVMGVFSGMKLSDISSNMSKGFGNTMGSIGIIIVFGIVLGELLHESGCTEQIAALMLRLVGQKNAAVAVNLTGYIVSIPVFFDAAFVILINLIKQLSRKGKIPFITLVSALAVGLITTHALVIPTPGPLAVAGTMGLNVGWMLLYSMVVALVGSLSAVSYAKWLGRKKENAEDFANAFDDIDERDDLQRGTGSRPSGGLGIFLIFLPIIIILTGTISTVFVSKDSAAYSVLSFFGDKNIALLIGVVVAFFCLRKYLPNKFVDIISKCADQAGAILVITGAGGAFGQVINATGIGDKLVTGMKGAATGAGASIILILIAFVISQILRAAQGSTTVALVTTSSIFAPLMASFPTVSPLLIGLAICAGGIGCSLPNDSGFWVVNRFSKFSVQQTIQAWTIGGTISGVVALICILLLSLGTRVLPGLL